MAEFKIEKLEKSNVNSGQEFKNGDSVKATDINAIVGGILHNTNNIDNLLKSRTLYIDDSNFPTALTDANYNLILNKQNNLVIVNNSSASGGKLGTVISYSYGGIFSVLLDNLLYTFDSTTTDGLHYSTVKTLASESFVNSGLIEKADLSYVDKKSEELSYDIYLLKQLAIQKGDLIVSEITQSYTERTTANGANIVDGALSILKKVQGNTVRTTNEFDISKLPTSTSLTKTDRDVFSGSYARGTEKTLKYLFPYLKVGKTYTFYADIEIDGSTEASQQARGSINLLGGRYLLGASYGNTRGRRVGVVKNITQDWLDANVYFYGPNVTWKDLMCVEGEYTLDTIPEWTPFFTGLKNTSFQGIKSVGGNLLPVKVGSITIDGVSYTRNEDGSFALSGTATADVYVSIASFNKLNLPSGQYYLSSNVLSGAQLIGQTRNNGKYISQIATGVGAFTVDYNGYDTVEFWIFIANGTTVNGTIHPMLNVGDTAQETAPHTEDTLLLPEVVDCGLGTIIDFENRQIEQTYAEYTFTGNEYWQGAGQTNTGAYRYFTDALRLSLKWGVGQYGVCDRFEVLQGSWTGMEVNTIRLGQDNPVVYFVTEQETTNEELQNLTRGIILRYPIATPTITPFTQEQINVGDTVKSYKHGIESVQGNDNSAWAENTLTQEYFELGGTTNE